MVKGNIRSSDGSAVVEFAVVLPVGMLLLFGIIQWGLVLNAQLSLQNAAEVTIRQVVVNGVASGSNAYPTAVNVLPGNLDPGQLDPDGDMTITVADAPITIPGGGTVNGQQVTLVYNLPIFLPFVVPGSSGGVKTLTADAIMR